MHLILGSSSRWRARLLQQELLGGSDTFELLDPNIDEKAVGGDRNGTAAEILTVHIGESKIDAVLELLSPNSSVIAKPAVVVTCDQVITSQKFRSNGTVSLSLPPFLQLRRFGPSRLKQEIGAIA